MARTQLTGYQLNDSSVQREDLDSTTVGHSVVKKLVAGTGINITYTGADSGTGDVTINVDPTGSTINKADITYIDAQDAGLANQIAGKADAMNLSIYSVNAATRLIQTQTIVARLVSLGKL